MVTLSRHWATLSCTHEKHRHTACVTTFGHFIHLLRGVLQLEAAREGVGEVEKGHEQVGLSLHPRRRLRACCHRPSIVHTTTRGFQLTWPRPIICPRPLVACIHAHRKYKEGVSGAVYAQARTRSLLPTARPPLRCCVIPTRLYCRAVICSGELLVSTPGLEKYLLLLVRTCNICFSHPTRC